MEIANAVAVVSGGASGLGEAVVRRLISDGARVVIADVQQARGAALAEALGPAALFVPCDVTREREVQQLLESAVRLGPLRVVVGCAGIALAARLLDRNAAPHDLAAFQRVLEVNVVGAFNLLRLSAAAIVAQSSPLPGTRAVMINIGSIAAFEGQVGQAAYAASKGALVSLTLPLARELAAHQMRVCTICPGLMDTPLLAALPTAARSALAESIPFPPRLGAAEELAALVAHVVENEYLNGVTLRLDGALRMAAR